MNWPGANPVMPWCRWIATRFPIGIPTLSVATTKSWGRRSNHNVSGDAYFFRLELPLAGSDSAVIGSGNFILELSCGAQCRGSLALSYLEACRPGRPGVLFVGTALGRSAGQA